MLDSAEGVDAVRLSALSHGTAWMIVAILLICMRPTSAANHLGTVMTGAWIENLA